METFLCLVIWFCFPLTVVSQGSSYYRLPQCTNNILQISETELDKPIYCEGLHDTDLVHWEIVGSQGVMVRVAFCQNKNRIYSCNSTNGDVTVSRNESTSQLVIENYTRADWANKTLTCVREDGVRMVSCRIRVMYPAVLGHPTVTLHDNFTVTANITVEKVFDSDFNTSFVWIIVKGQTITHSLTTLPSLTPFTEGQDGRVFYKGTCSVTMAAPSEEGHFSVHVRMLLERGFRFVGNFNTTKPGELRLEAHSCPEYVAEGHSIQCKCRHLSEDKGSPPAGVSWAQQSGSAVLTVNKVTMKDNGTTYTCNSTWGPSGEVHSSLEYTILVAYGPSNATVSRQINSTHPEENESFTCTSDAVYPAAYFSWNLACLTGISKLQISTCVVAQESLLNKTEVVCQVLNSKFPELNSSASFKLPDPAVLGHSTVTLHDNFTVTATVTLEKVFDSDFNISCWWTIFEGQTTKRFQTTRPSLSPYTEEQDGREYYNGTCSVTMDAPSEGGHFSVDVRMVPGGGLALVGDFNMTQPGELRLQKKSCPEYVAEGQHIQCKCRHLSKDKGSPPARVSWAKQDGSAVLTVNNVTMKNNGTVYTCHSTWGSLGEVNTSLEYTILAAYGPSNATVSRQVDSTYLENKESFICTSDDVYPTANFSWNLQCLTVISGLQSSTCVVAHESLLHKTEVVCQVLNSKLPELNSSASFKLPDGKQAHGLNLLVIGSAVAAAVVIVIVGCIIFAIVVVTRRRRSPKSSPTNQDEGSPRPSPPDDQDDEFAEFINDIYEGADGMPLPHVLKTNSAKPSSPAAQQSPAPASSFRTTAGAPTDSLDNIYTEISETTATETDASQAKKDEASFPGKGSGNKEGIGKENSTACLNVGKSSPRDQSQDERGVPETDDEYNTLKFAKKTASNEDPTYSHL